VYSQGFRFRIEESDKVWREGRGGRSLIKADYRNTLNVSRFVRKVMNMLGLYLIGLFAHLKAASLVGLRRVLIIHGYSIGQVLSIYIHTYIHIYIRKGWATGEFQSAKRSAMRALRNSGKLSLWNCRDSYQVSGTGVAKLISFARKFSGRDIRDPEIPEETGAAKPLPRIHLGTKIFHAMAIPRDLRCSSLRKTVSAMRE